MTLHGPSPNQRRHVRVCGQDVPVCRIGVFALVIRCGALAGVVLAPRRTTPVAQPMAWVASARVAALDRVALVRDRPSASSAVRTAPLRYPASPSYSLGRLDWLAGMGKCLVWRKVWVL